MLAAVELIEIGDHVMFANNCFVGDADHRYDDPTKPVTWQGFEPQGPVRIGSNCWFGVGCVVTGGVEIGERCVIGANSVVTKDLPAGRDRRRGAGEGDPRDRVQATARRIRIGASRPVPRVGPMLRIRLAIEEHRANDLVTDALEGTGGVHQIVSISPEPTGAGWCSRRT